ncbi:MAG: dihydrodipicolinate synthase family protein [Candidatus Latescibacterota bacterium]
MDKKAVCEQFNGVYPALLTPFDKKVRVNEEELRALVEHHLSCGLRGFFVCGSSGEGFLLRVEERKRVAEIVVEQTAGRRMCIIHVGHTSSDVAAELAQHAESIGADAISSVPPIYYKVGFAGCIYHYRTIAEACSLPFIVYNVPATTGVSVTTREMAELFRIETIIGMKFTDSDYYEMHNIIESAAEECLILSGSDQLFVPALAMGAGGAIGTTQNIMPEFFVKLHQTYLAGDFDAARLMQYQANRVIRELVASGSLSGWKAVLKAQGFDFGPCRAPLKTLTGQEEAALLERLEGLEAVSLAKVR